jgi:hypothetical protein
LVSKWQLFPLKENKQNANGPSTQDRSKEQEQAMLQIRMTSNQCQVYNAATAVAISGQLKLAHFAKYHDFCDIVDKIGAT